VGKHKKQRLRYFRFPFSVIQYSELLIHPSALKHGHSTIEIQHAIQFSNHHFHIDDSNEADRILIIGPNIEGNFLELIGVITDRDELLIIHSMSLRPQFHPLLER
jgi:hypothetical protein